MIVSLIGYRGCGKSSLAPLIAAELGYDSVDTDQQIEARAGCTISEIFAREGEAAFRELEKETIRDVYAGDELVVATGGGAVLNPDSRGIMQEAGPVFWLTADVDEIVRRLTRDQTTESSRPALTNLTPAKEIRSLLAKRNPIYRELCSFEIDTTNRSLEQITRQIITHLGSPAASPSLEQNGGEK